MSKEEMAEDKDVSASADSCLLPNDDMESIFARLPGSDIYRLRFVSRQWRLNVIAKESEFKLMCADTHPKMFRCIVAN
ncbi:hypothetical protein KC19_11G110600 [Ceratodon purpureus]|uniref:F-box domain-containing protein n=1 Tax=Ceratodon purpureus TaxID=3225 RepID=A0A8T0GJB0_CERPU|nr:hypothetical protein KC19_11G110600 [Ceratodon purpureus]